MRKSLVLSMSFIIAMFCVGNDAFAVPTLTASPVTVNPGDPVIVTFTDAPGNELDWIGMYYVSDPDYIIEFGFEFGMEIDGYYLVGMKNGQIEFTAPEEAGDYNFRMFPDDAYAPRLAVSNTFRVVKGTIPGGQATLSASPTTVKPGEEIVVTFTNAPGNAKDWIGIYRVGATDEDFVEAYYIMGYNNGTLTFTAPEVEGNYEFRMFPNDAYSPRLAVSNLVTVTKGTVPGQASIIAAPASVKPGGDITVSYTGAPGGASDWIGMFKVAAPDGQYITYEFLRGNKSGTLNFTAPNEEGQYNFRMFPNNQYEPLLATSNTVTVSSSGQPVGDETAIQKAMSWLAKQQKDDGHFCDSYYLCSTAVAVQALEERGHLPDQGALYSSVVEKGLDYIFSKAVIENISAQKAGNPDSDGDGKGVVFKFSGYEDRFAYVNGICISAIYASRSPNRVVNTGTCAGWRYSEVVRDAIDYLAFAQDDDKGGWKYIPHVSSDNSASQWPAFGMIYAEQWGLIAPGWMKSELNRWVDYIQNANEGGSGYESPNDLNTMSPIGRTGGMLIEMYYLGDRSNSARVQKAVSYIDNKDRWAASQNKGNAYATFAIYKGLRLMSIKSLPNAVQDGDWYNDYVQWILKNQNADGYWTDNNGSLSVSHCMATGWYIMMLEDVVKPLPTVTPQQPNVTLPADGQSSTGVTVSVNDPEGQPLPGQNVTMTVPQGQGTMSGVIDNGNGTYTGTYTAGSTTGQVTITITVTNLGISTTVIITLVQPGTITGGITLEQPPPATIPADGTTIINITIIIKDNNGAPVIGQNVTATIKTGSGNLSGVKDNGNGSYTTTYTAGNQPGVVIIVITHSGNSVSTQTNLVPPSNVPPSNLPTGVQSDTCAGFPGHYYAVIKDTKTWHEAKAYAESLGGHLVTISSDTENRCVTDMAKAKGASPFWIGFTDEAQEGNFVWITGEPPAYKNWNAGEPNNALGNEDYTEIGLQSTYTWNDYPATAKLPFVVEFDGIVTQPGGVGGASLFASPGTVKPGEDITVTYSGAPGNARDWIGMYKEGAANQDHLPPPWWSYLNGAKSGTLTFKAPQETGNYNFRMFPDDKEDVYLAISNLVVVSSGAVTGRTLIIPEVTGSPGQNVTVPINITDAASVAGADINVQYDSRILKIGEIKTTTLSAGMNLVVNTNTPGKAILRLAGTTAIAGGSGALIDIIFTIDASATAGTETPVTFQSAEAFDINANNIQIGTQNGKVKISAACVKGDVNNDGKINSGDAILALRISAGLINPTAQQFCAADYNSDNSVKSNDSILILRKSAGLIAPGKEPFVSTDRFITATLGDAYGEAGQAIMVPVKVDNPEVLAGGDLRIAYKSSVLNAVEVISQDDIMMAGNVSEPGIVRISFAAGERLNREILAYIKFNVIANDISPLEIQNYELYDHNAVLLSSVVRDKEFVSYLSKPKYSALLQNFPNPFNPDTWIPYQINEDCEVNIWILNSKGAVVRKLDLGQKPAGLYMNKDRAAYWDGKDDNGSPVASGVYFYSIKAGELSDVKKMIILK